MININKLKKEIALNNLSIEELSEKIGIDKYLIENIENSIKGIDEYDQLSSKDLDNVIKAFQSFVSKIE